MTDWIWNVPNKLFKGLPDERHPPNALLSHITQLSSPALSLLHSPGDSINVIPPAQLAPAYHCIHHSSSALTFPLTFPNISPNWNCTSIPQSLPLWLSHRFFGDRVPPVDCLSLATTGSPHQPIDSTLPRGNWRRTSPSHAFGRGSSSFIDIRRGRVTSRAVCLVGLHPVPRSERFVGSLRGLWSLVHRNSLLDWRRHNKNKEDSGVQVPVPSVIESLSCE